MPQVRLFKRGSWRGLAFLRHESSCSSPSCIWGASFPCLNRFWPWLPRTSNRLMMCPVALWDLWQFGILPSDLVVSRSSKSFWNRIRNIAETCFISSFSSEMVQVCTAAMYCSTSLLQYLPHQLLRTSFCRTVCPNRLSSQVQLPRCFPTSRGTTASLELVHCAPCLVCRPRFQMVPTPCQTLAMVVRDPFMLGSSTLQWLEGAVAFPCSWYGCQVWMLKDGTSKKQRSGLF